jgi:amidophosphoribosyltransferase
MCGIVGVYSSDTAASVALLQVLEQLEHRGGDGVGVAAVTTEGMRVAKGSGRLQAAYAEDWPTGTPMIGHTRYRTAGGHEEANVQPLLSSCGQIALAHNGELTNVQELRDIAVQHGVLVRGTSDSNALVAVFTVFLSEHDTIEQAVFALMQQIRGSYSVVAVVDETLVAFRDPYGNRPLFIGEIPGGYLVASEDGSMNIVNPQKVRAILPGECVIISTAGVQTSYFVTLPVRRPCIFECVYFARPDTTAPEGKMVLATRFSAGRRLAEECSVQADVVVPVPDSSIDAAAGFADATAMRLLSNALIKNRGRSFTASTQVAREEIVRAKFHPVQALLEGKRVVLVDDSIVRGTTMRILVQMIRNAGATEVHVRSASPPVRYRCYYGIDIKTGEELIATRRTVEQIRQYIGADSLGYVSVTGLIDACGGSTYCTACFTGEYDIPRE